MLSKTNTYVKICKGETKQMNFVIIDEKLLK